MTIPSTATIDGAQYLEQDEVVIKYEIQRAKDIGKGGIQGLSSMRLQGRFSLHVPGRWRVGEVAVHLPKLS